MKFTGSITNSWNVDKSLVKPMTVEDCVNKSISLYGVAVVRRDENGKLIALDPTKVEIIYREQL